MSAIGGALIGVGGTLLGYFLSNYLQKSRQEREWKRQFNAKMLEQVYKKLYDGIDTVISALETKKHDMFLVTGWGGIQKDTSYVVIDDSFRNTMDEFFKRTERYNHARRMLLYNFIPNVVEEVSEEVYGKRLKPEEIHVSVKYSYAYGEASFSPNFLSCLVSTLHPTEYVLVGQIDGKLLDFTVENPTWSKGKEIFDKFWNRCVTMIRENRTHQYLVKEDIELLKEAQNVKKLISKRIEDAWKV